MQKFDHQKYRPFKFAPKALSRSWPDKVIKKAPIWCSVDLRDGNQALIDPMTIEQKMEYWDALIECGFKQIETGFPSASQTEFNFHRKLIEENKIPDDVTIQVLVQAREHLIEKTFNSLVGCRRAIVHVYNSTSYVQREKAFKKTKEEILKIATDGAALLKKYAEKYPETKWVFEYSPESFSQTEPDYAISVCEAVCRVWEPEFGQSVILNLPATVEASTPNLFADQVEYFCQNLPSRKYVDISVHTHNDRGCAIAAGELAILAGADRVEGTLFGNGERTGNMDVITMAMNLYSQGIDPKLDFSNMMHLAQVAQRCSNLPIHPRHPYVGDLVFTAFSGSHQDAIKKCLEVSDNNYWDIAYLPINPNDIGRSYEDVVRINSQSGKGGVAYILQQNYGVDLPRWLQINFASIVQTRTEEKQKELSVKEVWSLFEKSYMPKAKNCKLISFELNHKDSLEHLKATISYNDKLHEIKGEGKGTFSSFITALKGFFGKNIRVLNYNEHALSSGTSAVAMAYVQLDIDGQTYIGAASNQDTVTAMLHAAVASLNNYDITSK